ncbi:hypothetical protein ACGFYV_02350 [Streptomyces sp. NPDC048297]|uniref:hypothetical protein n=1 Tax=Streptomyces sp. NPDC048297 TaxID=3365531 RepID=UPI00370FC93E
MSRTGAAILVLLAALLHLLACAHGPAPVSGAGFGTLPTGPAAVAVVTADAGSGHDPEQHCCHAEEPTVQAPRDADLVLPSAHLAASGDGAAKGFVPAPGPGRSPAPAARGRSVGRSLALLGVWRT